MLQSPWQTKRKRGQTEGKRGKRRQGGILQTEWQQL